MAKKALLFVLVALACVACRLPPDDAAPASSQHPALAAPAGAAWARSAPNTFAGSRRASFASLADRGDLVAYPVPAPARPTGAYTWHRAELSEAHAFQSLQTGLLRITSPSGQPLEFEYSRHVEHPSGDWTWIGRLKGGAPSDEAVITFGERAAFGSIAEPGKPALRLTTAAGAAWLIETDPAKIASIDNEATRPTRPDYFIPPDQAASLSAVSDMAMSAKSAAATGAAVAAAATTLDVVIGYTNGFAAGLGGHSQAVTRLNNMVEITNQAYVNSQVDAAVRMVHALPVDYADNTDNRATLEALTGYRSGTGAIPVDPAFAALRSARDQYGGDLVTLVRKFQTPENDGCGIAWLIGGGRSGFDTGDAPFGYSVVSDGVDMDTDGKSYFCREETLAHELGHNMGSQHDRVSATENGTLKYGVFTYSFGYKTDATNGNFYTVMAYGDRGQVTYRVFSNPRIAFCGGLPCGQADVADNARSIVQIAPTVADFRAATTTEPNPGVAIAASSDSHDIDADRRADFMWHNPASREIYYWLMNGPLIRLGQGGVLAPANTTPRAVGDFNADGHADIVLASGNDIWIYSGNASGTFSSSYVAVYPVGWSLAGVADVDGDGRSDFVWFNPATLELYYWLMSGGSVRLGRGNALAPQNTSPRALADFNRDGRADIVLASASDIWVYLGNASGGFQSAYLAVYPVGWQLVGSGDVDADSWPDLVWHQPNTRELYYWLMSGASIRLGRGGVLSPPATTPRTVADFNADGRADIVFTSSSDIWMYQGNVSGTFTSAYVAVYPVGWNLL